jgi:hypothetical protein
MKIRPMSAELFHANGEMDERTDRQTDRQTQTGRQTRDEPKVIFRSFPNESQNLLSPDKCS